MNCPDSATRRKPIVVKVGNAAVKVYRGKCRGYDLFTVVSYRPDGEKRKRFRQSFASLAQARLEATRIATAIANTEGDVLKLKSSDRATYLHAVSALRSLKIPLHVAVEEYVQARQHAGGANLIDAAKEYAQRHASEPVRKLVAEVVREFIGAKQQDGMSARYLRSLRSHLSRFAEHFQMPIAAVTAAQIEDWLRGTKRGPRTRKNLRNSLVTLFRFAKRKGYLLRALITEAEHVERPRDRGGKIGILSPEQLARLLDAGNEEARLYLALAAFTGLRRCELLRLHWEDFLWARAKIDIGKDKAKTASRRLVPIQPNLMQWLAPFSGRTGRVFQGGEEAVYRTIAFAKKLGVEWPNNALRHSYASYRLEQIQDAPRVALEMGNSSQMLFRNYRELADEEDARAWFRIAPPTRAPNVVQMPVPSQRRRR
jgi:integrase